MRTGTIVTDASADGAGGLAWKDRRAAPDLDSWAERSLPSSAGLITVAFEFSQAEMADSSAVREVLALLMFLKKLLEPSDTNSISAGIPAFINTADGRDSNIVSSDWSDRSIFWYSDSSAAVSAISKWRSGSNILTNVIRELWELADGANISIFPHWVSRELGWLPAADFLSRVVGRRKQTEWAISDELFAKIKSDLRVDLNLDAFASNINKKCPRFLSRHIERDSLGSAFAKLWAHEKVYAFPPFSMVREAVSHWRRSPGATLVLLAPRKDPAVREALQSGEVLRVLGWPASERLLDVSGIAARFPPPRHLAFYLFRHQR